MELDQEQARARSREIEGIARRSLSGEGGRDVSRVHGATFTATVSPSRNGTRVVTKSEAS